MPNLHCTYLHRISPIHMYYFSDTLLVRDMLTMIGGSQWWQTTILFGARYLMADLRCLSAASALIVHHCVFTQTDIVRTPSKEPWGWSYCVGGTWEGRGKVKVQRARGDVCRVSISINQLINQSISQLTNQSVNRSINQSTNQSINRLINRSINQSIDQSINQSINRSTIKGHMWHTVVVHSLWYFRDPSCFRRWCRTANTTTTTAAIATSTNTNMVTMNQVVWWNGTLWLSAREPGEGEEAGDSIRMVPASCLFLFPSPTGYCRLYTNWFLTW